MFCSGCEARAQSLKDKGAETALASTNEQVNLMVEDQSEQAGETSSDPYTCRSCMCSVFQGGKETVSINIYPALTDHSIVLQIDDRLYELADSLDDLSSEVRSILRGTTKLRQNLPHEA